MTDLSQTVAYLTAAEAILPPQHQWLVDMNQVRTKIIANLSDVRHRNNTGFSYHTQQQLSALQKTYLQAYLHLHHQARLGEAEDLCEIKKYN